MSYSQSRNDNLSSSGGSGSFGNIKINDGSSFILALRGLRANPAKQIDLVDSIANEPVKAIKIFGEVLSIPAHGVYRESRSESEYVSQSDVLSLALAIQGFGKISDLETKSEIASLQTDFAANLLYILEKEAQSNNALVCWSALHSINEIWFHQEWQKKKRPYAMKINLQDSPRLEKSVVEQQLQPLYTYGGVSRNSETGYGLNAQYEAWRDFWVYGAVEVLVNVPRSEHDYQILVSDVLDSLSYRGVEVGVSISVNSDKFQIVTIALKLAEKLLRENCDRDVQQRIYDIPDLRGFLSNSSDMDMRRLAARALCHLSTQIDNYDSGAVKKIRARSHVICEDWQKVLQAGIDAVQSLVDVAKGKLRLNQESNFILRDRLIAINTLGQIKYDPEQKIDHLAIFLLDELQEIRDKSLEYLTPMTKYMSNSDSEYIPLQNLGKEVKNRLVDIHNIITSLLSELPKFNISTYDFHKLKVNDIENILTGIKQGREKLQKTRLIAITSSEILGNQYKLSPQFLKQFIENKMLKEVKQIDDWIKNISHKKLSLINNQRKIIKNKVLLREIVDSCKDIDAKTHSLLISMDIDCPNEKELANMTYDECHKIFNSLNLVKEKVVEELNNLKHNILNNGIFLEADS